MINIKLDLKNFKIFKEIVEYQNEKPEDVLNKFIEGYIQRHKDIFDNADIDFWTK